MRDRLLHIIYILVTPPSDRKLERNCYHQNNPWPHGCGQYKFIVISYCPIYYIYYNYAARSHEAKGHMTGSYFSHSLYLVWKIVERAHQESVVYMVSNTLQVIVPLS